MSVRIKNDIDAEDAFDILCKKEIKSLQNQSENSYGFVRVPSITNPVSASAGYPIIEETKSLNRLIELFPVLNRNLDYNNTPDEWRQFYCFPDNDDVESLTLKEKISQEYVANASDTASQRFRDRVIEISSQAKTNTTTNFIFLSGTTGVGKTTYVKFHTRTQKNNYLKNDIIISRLKFRDLEKRISNLKISEKENNVSEDKLRSPLAIFEEHIIDCLFRDLIQSYNITRKYRNDFPTGVRMGRLEAAVLEAEAMIEELGELEKVDIIRLKKVFDLSEGELQKISHNIKISTLEFASKNGFRFTLFLDGFDAIEPETIKLEKNEESSVFLSCLEAVALSSFSGSGLAYEYLHDTPIVFVISARPITVAQIELSLQGEVDFRQQVHHSEFVAPSKVFKIINKRTKVRGREQSHLGLISEDVKLLEEVMRRCLSELHHEYPSIKNGKFINLFNHNIRDKIGFLLLLAGFFIAHLTKYIHDNSHIKLSIREKNTPLKEIVKNSSLSDLNIVRYELEKILFLNRNEKFSNYFIYDLHNDRLTSSPDKGSFDNIYNYRLIHSFGDGSQPMKCPLLVKREILRKIVKEHEVQHADLVGWLNDSFPECWSTTDLKLLIRGGLVAGEFDGGVIIYSATDKGIFLLNELHGRYAYFERACVAAALPRFVRRRMHVPIETSGGQWGRSSIVNVGLFIRYLRAIEEEQCIPEENREADHLMRGFSATVRRLASTGLSGKYPTYASELEQALKIALE